MNRNIYTTLREQEYDTALLSPEESDLYRQAKNDYEDNPEWIDFEQKWVNAALSIYDRQKLPRRETIAKPLYRIVRDMGSRLMVAAGYAKMPSYRSQLESLIESKFQTRREFCEATGISEDMLSHVLSGRKDASIASLTEALAKIGYGLQIVPIPKPAVPRNPER
jgi:hypothetical protein